MRPAKHPTQPSFFVETLEDLDALTIAFKAGGTLFADVETTKFNPRLTAFSPYTGARVVGFAVSWRDPDGTQHPIYYISLRHRDLWANNLNPVLVAQWFADQLRKAKRWVNHNVKFDAHFMAMECHLARVDTGLYFYEGDWYCTRVAAKLLDSDRLEYHLKDLAEDWLGKPKEHQNEIKAYLKSLRGPAPVKGKKGHKGSKDYGDVPSTMLGEYAINDISINIELYDFIESKLDPSLEMIFSIERRLTPVLFDMEREGIKIDMHALLRLKLETLEQLLGLENELSEISGYEFNGNSNKLLAHIILNNFGLPVMHYSESTKYIDGRKVVKKGGPSFDAEALEGYEALPAVVNDPKKARFFECLVKWRELSTFLSMYLDGWMPHIDCNNRLHADYNQIIRTGRMSCSDPCLHQLNKKAKALIICEDDEELCANDASQIEFRLIAEYMAIVGDTGALEAYVRDPKTDYHKWTAGICEIDRPPAKTVNFLKAYGGGKQRLKRALRGLKLIIQAVKAQVDHLVADGRIEESKRVATYDALIDQRATNIIAIYEERLPGIKRASDLAKNTCLANGYVRNFWGFRRHLPKERAHIAFNSAVQGGAMVFIKTRMIATSPRYNPTIRAANIKLRINVHDELVYSAPRGTFTTGVHRWLLDLLETQEPVKLRVPLLWEGGVSTKNWADASKS